MSTVNLAYLWGEDAFGIAQAVRAFAIQAAPEGETLDTWYSQADAETDEEGGAAQGSLARRRARLLEEVEQRLTSVPLFGGGTLVVVRQPAALLAEQATRDRIMALVASVPPGNALCFADLVGSDGKLPATRAALRDAVKATGGLVHESSVPRRDHMESWLADRAAALGVRLGPGAARELATRIGAHVRESDVDRRRQTELANSELEKLALYRPGGTVSSQDVADLVAESVPGSAWAFLDAVGGRRGTDAVTLHGRLLADGVVLPVLLSQLHRRIRELIVLRDHLDAGDRPAEIGRSMKLVPYRAQKLAEQAARWTASELSAALDGLLELELRSKGIGLDGRSVPMSDSLDALALDAWLAQHVAVRIAPARRG